MSQVKVEEQNETTCLPAKSKASSNLGKKNTSTQVALCASCDRCRARKTKCDGKRPCGNCAARYLKKHKLDSIEGIDISKFECVYSPAKRRGPVPGKAGQARKASEALNGNSGRSTNSSGRSKDMNPMGVMSGLTSMGMGGIGNSNLLGLGGLSMGGPQGILGAAGESAITAEMLQQHLENQHNSSNQMAAFGNSVQNKGNGLSQMDVNETMSLQRQLLLQQQLAMQGLNFEKNQALNTPGIGNSLLDQNFNTQGLMGGFSSQQAVAQQQLNLLQQLQSQQQQQQQHVDVSEKLMNIHSSQRQKSNPTNEQSERMIFLRKNFSKYANLLHSDSLEGNRLRSYYNLSINECFNLPPIPTDEDYCSRLNGHITPNMLPRFDLSALKAARFSEIALGALVNNQTSLALKLSNATVLFLRECVEESIHQSCKLDLARAYFLHGLFRYFRGDMERYFKYRRVCMKYISQLDKDPAVFKLVAAVSFNDASAYMTYNAEEFGLPNINNSIPPLQNVGCNAYQSSAEFKYDKGCSASDIVRDPINQMWIQGAPQVFVNNEAPLYSRALDALSFAIRHCCDQANTQFSQMTNELGEHLNSPTANVVGNSQGELCSRNMVMSAFSFLQRLEAESTTNKFVGLRLFISGMDAFLEGGDEEEDAGLTDSQIQGLLSVCNTVVQNPLLLFMPGPTYHMVTNATVMLCHLLNAMYARMIEDSCPGETAKALFEETVETFTSVNKLLKNHRSKLPVRLRCHEIPSPSYMPQSNTRKKEFIALGDIHMCSSRSCQGFVLMSCSPCVAAERARASMAQKNAEESENKDDENVGTFDQELRELGLEFDMDDDALLKTLSRIISA